MPLKRKPPKGNERNVHSNGKTTTGVTINNNNEIVQFESGKENILLLLFLRDKTIKRIVSQPLKISYYDPEGKPHTYTGDFLVERMDGSIEIHEFSMSAKRIKPEAILRENAAKKYCDERGWKYIVHTEFDLPSPTGMDNLDGLFGFCARAYCEETVNRELAALLGKGERVLFSSIVSEIEYRLGIERQIIYGAIYHQLWLGSLCTDLNELIFIESTPNPKMLLWLPL